MNSTNDVFHFTVAQLIEELKKLPGHLPVVSSGYENGFENFYAPEVIRLKHEPQNLYYDGEFQDADENDPTGFDAAILQRVLRSD